MQDKAIYRLMEYISRHDLDRMAVIRSAELSAEEFGACERGERELMAEELLRICIYLEIDPLMLASERINQ